MAGAPAAASILSFLPEFRSSLGQLVALPHGCPYREVMQKEGSAADAAQLFARARAAREQARTCRSEFTKTRQRLTELVDGIAQARERAELVRKLWISPGRDSDVRYSALARMQALLDTMPVIEQAKGIIMAQCGWPADLAFDALRRASQNTNVKVRVLAKQIVDATAASAPQPPRLGSPARPGAGEVLRISHDL